MLNIAPEKKSSEFLRATAFKWAVTVLTILYHKHKHQGRHILHSDISAHKWVQNMDLADPWVLDRGALANQLCM